MNIELLYYDLADDKYIFSTPLKFEGYTFTPSYGDILLLDGWAYSVGRKEFYYETNTTYITIFCTKEEKKRL